MTKEDLKKKLQQRYDRENWIDMFQNMFPNVSYLQNPLNVNVSHEKVKSFKQLGNVHLTDGKTLALFEVHLDEKINLVRNRVELRNLTAKYIDQAQIHGVLAIFSSESDDYRFTFTSKDAEFNENMELVTRQTEPKRYTYVLGPNETCTTAADRFHSLCQKKLTAQLSDVLEAFSVEKLNKEFFGKYKNHYENFVQYLTGMRFVKQSGKWKEKKFHDPHEYLNTVFHGENKLARDFVKKLLGRIVFLYFLQKKGWMGCPADSSDWKDGDPQFLKNFFENKADPEKFHSRNLSKLFFESLNKPDRHNDVFDLTDTRIPYLNGGLFEADSVEIQKMDFPSEYFKDLFEFFSQYNFTIDENDPNDHEVGIDPEMLGHIFENLLEDNKDKGAFYTPKPIVQYMCEESLIQYLKTEMEKMGGSLEKEEIEAIDKLIRHNEKGEEKKGNFIHANAKLIEELLDKVKICDPAIGSGAFPMGLLQKIYQIKMTLDWTLNPATVKRNIIQNSIYGVDIDKGAIDIARLRFWLALIVDEDEPLPLPNLDYKIMQGNSLLESFEGIDLKFDHTQYKLTEYKPEKDLFGNPVNPQVSLMDFISTSEGSAQFDFTRLEKEYFNSNDVEIKRKIKNELNAFEKSFIEEQLTKQIDSIENVISRLENDLAEKKKIIRKEEDYEKLREHKKLFEARKQLEEVQVSREKLVNLDDSEKPYFLWHLYFMDVFKQGGFDIVIGNPPYVQLQKNSGELADIYENLGFETFKRTGDIYTLFYEKGMNLLKREGHLIYISSNKWMKAGYGDLARGYFADHNSKLLIDFGGFRVFEEATVDTNILVIQNKSNENCLKAVHFKNDYRRGESLIKYFNNNSVELTGLSDATWFIGSKAELSLRSKIEMKGTPLKDWDIKINRGITTGCNEAFIIDHTTREKLLTQDPNSKEIIKPILRGKDIKRYGCKFAGLYILATGFDLNIETQYPAVYSFLNNIADKIEANLIKVRGKGLIQRDDQGQNWWNLRACTYYEDFEKDKIVYMEIQTDNPQAGYQFPCYSFDLNNSFTLNTAYIMTGDNVQYLLGVLNSKLGAKLVKYYVTRLNNRQFRMLDLYVKLFPIPIITNHNRKVVSKIESLVESITAYKQNNLLGDTSGLESEIDQLVYQLYDLTEEEIAIVEGEAK